MAEMMRIVTAQTLNECVSSKMKYFDYEEEESKKSKQSQQNMYCIATRRQE
jgi:hypothetical protein